MDILIRLALGVVGAFAFLLGILAIVASVFGAMMELGGKADKKAIKINFLIGIFYSLGGIFVAVGAAIGDELASTAHWVVGAIITVAVFITSLSRIQRIR